MDMEKAAWQCTVPASPWITPTQVIRNEVLKKLCKKARAGKSREPSRSLHLPRLKMGFTCSITSYPWIYVCCAWEAARSCGPVHSPGTKVPNAFIWARKSTPRVL